MPPMQFAVQTHSLSKTYRGRIKALQSADLEVPVGCAFGLLGPNGAGKSTLVKTLLSIVRATSGRAEILGRDFRNAESRREVGYLPENPRYPRYLTGRGVCTYFGRLSGLSGAVLKHEVEEKLAMVGMSEWAGMKVKKYSKGMAQRIGLAQAMLGNPKVLFLDEPTDGVDPVGRKDMRDLIKHMCETGITVFLNSHILVEVEQTCDQVAILHRGQIIQQGTVQEVISSIRTDQSGLVVRFEVSQIPDALWETLAASGAQSEGKRGFIMTLSSETDISRVVDQLRAAQVGIFAIQQVKANLEEAFIELIQGQEGAAVGGVTG